ncbi:MAG: thioesterase family protein [Pseudomonadota bacterium]|nr:thioesterase family protein [Pseudomonadota bacterium]
MNSGLDAEFAFRQSLQVRWGDMDALGHVNNARFFTYDESLRLDYFAQLTQTGGRLGQDFGLILARIECDFKAQLHAPATLEIGYRIRKIGRTSFRTESRMVHGDALIAVVQAALVWFDYAENRAIPVPGPIRERIMAFERIAPEN